MSRYRATRLRIATRKVSMDKPKGRNGEPAFSAQDVLVGRCPGGPYGYKRSLKVSVSIQMEWLTRRETYQTVDHEEVTQPLEFAITTDVRRPGGGDIVSGGATVKPLLEVTTYEAPWDKNSVAQLARLGQWNLNAMSAACAHQKRDAGLGSPPCPVTGYEWGHAWLVRPLPDDFLDTVRELFTLIDDGVWDPGR